MPDVVANAPAGELPSAAPPGATRMPEFCGHLHLTAARREDDSTALVGQSFRAPFHISKPYWDGHALHVQVVNSTAGILAGDALELDLRVQPGAALAVTTPAATRSFMMRAGSAACRQRLTVEAGGWLEYAPEPLCPHRDTHFSQETRVDVAAGGEACFVDALAPGRVGRGERWAWRHLELALEVRIAGSLLLRERFAGSGERLARLAAFHGTPEVWLATMLVISPRLSGRDLDAVRQHPAPAGVRVGMSSLGDGVMIARVLAPGGQALRDTLRDLRGILAETLPSLRADFRKL